MTSLALLLLVRSEGESYGAAGLVVAVYAVALGIGAPIGGRQVDRYGPIRVLQIRAVLFAAFLGAVVALALLGAGIAAIAAAAAIAGFSMPPLSSTVRVVWPRLARDELRSTAYALEASLQEVHFIGGPLVAAALAAVEPVAAVAGSGLASLVGTTMVARLPPVRETPPSRSGGAGLLGALGSPGVRTIIGYAAVAGLAFGAVELAMPALAEEHGARELGGVALAYFAAGSLVGGLLAGLRPADSDLRRFVGGAFVLSAAMLTLQLAVSIPTLCLLAFVAGLPIAPTIGATYTLIDRSARAGTVAEAFAWFGTAVSVGIAAGSAIGGVLVDQRGVRWSFALGAAIALVGAVLAWARRGTLQGRSPTAAR
jgi:MFS family permease